MGFFKRGLTAIAALCDALTEMQTAGCLTCDTADDAIIESRRGETDGGCIIATKVAVTKAEGLAVRKREVDADVAIECHDETLGCSRLADKEETTEPVACLVSLIVHSPEERLVGPFA